MTKALEQFAALLPDKWPVKGKGIGVEDWYAQEALDLLLGRDSEGTGSARSLERGALAPGGRSQNHKLAADDVRLWLGQGVKPLLSRFRDQERRGFMCDEQFARYVRFHARVAFSALLWCFFHNEEPEAPELEHAATGWVRGCWWWLEACEWNGEIYTPGCRRTFAPEVLDGFLWRVLGGRQVDTKHRQMGHVPAAITNGGFPRATDVWLGLACRELGLLPASPKKPKLRLPLVVERDERGILAYFPELEGRPGGDNVLAAVEMRKGIPMPWLWLVGPKDSLPAERWGFSPRSRQLEAA